MQSVLVTPHRTLTHKGMARAIIKPDTTGIVHVTARVENVTQEATFLVENQQNGTGTAGSEHDGDLPGDANPRNRGQPGGLPRLSPLGRMASRTRAHAHGRAVVNGFVSAACGGHVASQ